MAEAEAKSVLVFKGSPRRNGNSACLADQVAEGARAAGAFVEEFYLHGMEINACRGCDGCQKETAKDCVVVDDMAGLYPKIREAYALVYATPIYWFTVSAQTKLLMDRCYALGGPQGFAMAGKRIGLVMTYADTDPFRSGAVNAIRAFQDGFGLIGAPIVGMVYATAGAAGEVAGNAKAMEEARALGEQLVR